MKPHRNGRVPPRILEAITPVAGKHELDTQPGGRLAKRSDLVAGGGGKKKDLAHTGSAQQYHGSSTAGTAVPGPRRPVDRRDRLAYS